MGKKFSKRSSPEKPSTISNEQTTLFEYLEFISKKFDYKIIENSFSISTKDGTLVLVIPINDVYKFESRELFLEELENLEKKNF